MKRTKHIKLFEEHVSDIYLLDVISNNLEDDDEPYSESEIKFFSDVILNFGKKWELNNDEILNICSVQQSWHKSFMDDIISKGVRKKIMVLNQDIKLDQSYLLDILDEFDYYVSEEDWESLINGFDFEYLDKEFVIKGPDDILDIMLHAAEEKAEWDPDEGD